MLRAIVIAADPDEVLIETQKTAEPHLRIHAIWRINKPIWWRDVPSNTDIFIIRTRLNLCVPAAMREWSSTAQASWREFTILPFTAQA